MNEHSDILTDALTQAVTESLENMTFMQVSPVRMVWGRVGVKRPVRGFVTLAFSEGLAREIVHEMYGDTPLGDETETMADTVAEMANTVAGRLMSRILDEESAFELDLPEKGVGRFQCDQERDYVQFYEINGHLYIVVIEGEDLMRYQHVQGEMPGKSDEAGAEGWGT